MVWHSSALPIPASKDGDKMVDDVPGLKGSFARVLAGLKTYLEDGMQLNLVIGAFPGELRERLDHDHR